MSTLNNKNIVIIGGTTGLGLSAAKAFIDNGANVVVVGRNEESVIAAKNILGNKALTLSGDATQEATAINTIETCVANIPLNDKRLIVQKADEEFLYSPHNVKLTDGELFIDNDLFTYDTKRVQATFDLSDKYVIYQRADTVNQLSQTVSLDESYNVQCSKQYSYISYAVVIKVLSLDISKLESTPVIKNIAIITTE